MYKVIVTNSWYGSIEVYRGDRETAQLYLDYWTAQGAIVGMS